MTGSFSYITPEPAWETSGLDTPQRICPHCKEVIQPGDNVHWWGDILWHTKPCPTEG